MLAILHSLGMFIVDLFKSRRRLEAENMFLRHQLSIALRRAPPRGGSASIAVAPLVVVAPFPKSSDVNSSSRKPKPRPIEANSRSSSLASADPRSHFCPALRVEEAGRGRTLHQPTERGGLCRSLRWSTTTATSSLRYPSH